MHYSALFNQVAYLSRTHLPLFRGHAYISRPDRLKRRPREIDFKTSVDCANDPRVARQRTTHLHTKLRTPYRWAGHENRGRRLRTGNNRNMPCSSSSYTSAERESESRLTKLADGLVARLYTNFVMTRRACGEKEIACKEKKSLYTNGRTVRLLV